VYERHKNMLFVDIAKILILHRMITHIMTRLKKFLKVMENRIPSVC
jgi:hypothetical protein